MSLPMRKTARVLLFNNQNQLLLMCIEDFDICTISGTSYKRFWCTIGGGIEQGETIEEAAIREIYEETGLTKEVIQLGPIVWHDTIDLFWKGTKTRVKEVFIVARTSYTTVSLHPSRLSTNEQKVIKTLQWFFLHDLQMCTEKIFPESLLAYLPDVLLENYPAQPIEINK